MTAAKRPLLTHYYVESRDGKWVVLHEEEVLAICDTKEEGVEWVHARLKMA